jgi:hypothetical protein
MGSPFEVILQMGTYPLTFPSIIEDFPLAVEMGGRKPKHTIHQRGRCLTLLHWDGSRTIISISTVYSHPPMAVDKMLLE